MVLDRVPLALFMHRAIVRSMQETNELPDDLNTAQEVILVQSNVLVKQKTEIESLKKEREELLAEI